MFDELAAQGFEWGVASDEPNVKTVGCLIG